MTKWEIVATRCGRLVCGALLLLIARPLLAQSKQTVPFTDYPGYVAWMQKHHKAPFLGRVTQKNPTATRGASQDNEEARRYQNVKVNQDRNPWLKASIASAIDPSEPKNWVVMSNDFRENATRIFYHVSSDGGRSWTDDALMGGADIYIGSIPMTYLGNPAVSFDRAGNSYFSAFGGNLILDFTNNYLNLDSQVYEVQGFAHGTHSDISPTFLDAQSCSGTFGVAFVCPGTVSQPLNATDANRGSANAGANYVFYTYFCNLPDASCSDGGATIPSFGSVILEAHSAGAGQPYSAPSLVSGSQIAAQFSDMVIDPSGTPHIFFNDYTNPPLIALWESTLTGGVWTVSKTPVAQFVYNGLANPNWSFTDSGAAAPRCDIHGYTAFCAFSANQVSVGTSSAMPTTMATTPSVYLASVNVQSGVSRIARVNSDPVNDQKAHFFAAPAVTPTGDVYVGWYDNRKDPTNANVEYFVAKSGDGARTFRLQTAVSDVPFNPCNGLPGCGYFGDYTQLAAGADGSVHAAWSDTRDGVSTQIWSQTVRF